MRRQYVVLRNVFIYLGLGVLTWVVVVAVFALIWWLITSLATGRI